MVCAALALLVIGLCHGPAGAQLTIDDPLGVGSTYLLGMDGSHVVGFYTDSMGIDHGFVYDGSTFTPRDDPNATTTLFDHGTYATSIQGDTVVGSYTDSSGIMHGFTYDGTHFSTIDHPDGVYGTAAWGYFGGRISGTYADQFGQTHGFVIPEPGSIALLGSFGLSILPLHWRRRRQP